MAQFNGARSLRRHHGKRNFSHKFAQTRYCRLEQQEAELLLAQGKYREMAERYIAIAVNLTKKALHLYDLPEHAGEEILSVALESIARTVPKLQTGHKSFSSVLFTAVARAIVDHLQTDNLCHVPASTQRSHYRNGTEAPKAPRVFNRAGDQIDGKRYEDTLDSADLRSGRYRKSGRRNGRPFYVRVRLPDFTAPRTLKVTTTVSLGSRRNKSNLISHTEVSLAP